MIVYSEINRSGQPGTIQGLVIEIEIEIRGVQFPIPIRIRFLSFSGLYV